MHAPLDAGAVEANALRWRIFPCLCLKIGASRMACSAKLLATMPNVIGLDKKYPRTGVQIATIVRRLVPTSGAGTRAFLTQAGNDSISKDSRHASTGIAERKSHAESAGLQPCISRQACSASDHRALGNTYCVTVDAAKTYC